jgi:gamma-glutamyltranspeptidase/glutathione hydrolase
MLEAGGNAIDAAVASAFALGVCEPAASGIGGQTMMLIHLAEEGRTIALDGSSKAPHRATLDAVETKASRLRGHRATTVPSTPATLSHALEKFGTLKLSQVMAPAIRLAREGYPVTSLQAALTKRKLKNLRAGTAAPFFLKNGRSVYRVGETFKQPVLATTLSRLARYGIEIFYRGSIAKKIHRDMKANDGLLHLDDLAQIPWPIERKPVSCKFRGHRVLTFPPPGAGRTLVEMLHILENFPEKLWSSETPKGAILLAECIRQAFTDRQDRPHDPHHYGQRDLKKMCSPAYGRELSEKIRKRMRKGRKPGGGETTHLSVMDRQGNAVALTQSIERVYGSFAASPELGFLYNNYMSCFETDDMAHPYYLHPTAEPWASVAPTIVFRGRRPWLTIGSPGSDRITPSIAQVLLRLHAGQSPFDAVDAPRLHCSLDGDVSLEAARMRDDIPEALIKHGFTVNERDPYSFYLGCVQMVLRERGLFTGVADPRRDGSAAGPRNVASPR